MANILVLGVGPLPFEHTERLHAPGIRTWQLASAIASQQHFVTLCIIDFGDFSTKTKPGKPSPASRQELSTNIIMVRIAYHPQESIDAIRTLHAATRFSAIVSSSDIMNGIAADLELNLPLWLDYNGDPFAEKQLQANVYKHDGSLLPQWILYQKGLLRGDRFSVCSQAQRHALIGQLTFAGRLTGNNSGEELIQVLPNCSRVMAERTPVRHKILKGSRIPTTAFLVLWSGGYNTWCDPELLFNGLVQAMEQDPMIYFATTGGALEGHDTLSFSVFKELVESSPLRERFTFLGWIPTEEVGHYYEQADLAIFTDRYSVEGELGTRTRIIDWIQFQTPIACTKLCELAHELSDLELIETFTIGDPTSLAETILKVKSHPEEAKIKAHKALEWFNQAMDESVVFQPLIDWVNAPRKAGDLQITTTTNTMETSSPLSLLGQIQYNAVLRKPNSNESAHVIAPPDLATQSKQAPRKGFLGFFKRNR